METGNGQRRRIPFIEIGSRTVRVGVYIRRIPIEELEISLAQVERAGIVLLVVDAAYGDQQIFARLHRNIFPCPRNHKDCTDREIIFHYIRGIILLVIRFEF